MIDRRLTIVTGFIDYDADTQDREIRKIVTILQAGIHGYQGREPYRAEIVGALASYRAAVTTLVLAGNLNLDQGDELMGIVDRIERENT